MDEQGKKNVLEMCGDVWRWLSAIRAEAVDPSTGQESVVVQINELYTKQSVLLALNTALTKYSIDMMLSDETVLADEANIDVRENVVEYVLPTDLCFLKACWWKDPGTEFTIQPPCERTFMYSMDQIAPNAIDAIENGAPRYKRRLNLIVLDRYPTEDDVGAIKVEYIKWIQHLIDDDDRIETQYGRILQEAVILNAAKTLSGIKGGIQYATLDSELKEMELRLVQTSRAGLTPPFMHMVPRTHPFTVRPRGRYGRRWSK